MRAFGDADDRLQTAEFEEVLRIRAIFRIMALLRKETWYFMSD